MEPITVKKEELLEKLSRNRADHRSVFEDALQAYGAQAQETLEQYLSQLRRGQRVHIQIMMPLPIDRTRDYDRVIAMVKAHQGELFTLSEKDFQQYWMDDWTWKREFLRTSNQYAAASVAEVYGAFDEDDY
jgi:hypothetical protein